MRDVEGAEGRDGSGDLGLSEETEDADHGEAAVVDLLDQTGLGLLRAHVLGEAEGVVPVVVVVGEEG